MPFLLYSNRVNLTLQLSSSQIWDAVDGDARRMVLCSVDRDRSMKIQVYAQKLELAVTQSSVVASTQPHVQIAW
jgi:hypothetical protein